MNCSHLPFHPAAGALPRPMHVGLVCAAAALCAAGLSGCGGADGSFGASATTQTLGDPGAESRSQISASELSDEQIASAVCTTPPLDAFVISFGPGPCDYALSASADLTEAAARLFDALHAGAASHHARIAVQPIPHQDLGIAINDRLRRAAA